jgi:hypothetical protein
LDNLQNYSEDENNNKGKSREDKEFLLFLTAHRREKMAFSGEISNLSA